MSGNIIGIDIGGTKVAYGLFDRDRRLLAKIKHPSDSSLSAEAFFGDIARGIMRLLRQEHYDIYDLEGIGLGVPSSILFHEGKILSTVNLPNLKNFAVRDFLWQKLGVPGLPVVLDNDSHVAALAEYRFGAGKGQRDMVYCAVSTGIASSLIINGELLRGSYGCAGESGHMLVTPGRGELCGCGHRGCFESYASGSNIVKCVRVWLSEGQTSIIPELAGGAEKITAEHIAAAARRRDKLALQAVDQMAEYLGMWLFNIYVFTNINYFVFGGGLLNFGPLLSEKVRAVFDSYNLHPEYPVFFKKAALGEDFGIYGAAELID